MTKLLVVDNEKTIGLLLKDLLQDTGYEAIYTSQDEEACDLYQKGQIDLILTELRLDDDGQFPFIERIKAINPDALIIVITSHPSFDSIQAVLRMGVFDYITKPFNIDEISFSINRAISYLKLQSINQALLEDLASHSEQLEKVVEERTEGLQFLFNITREIYSTLGLREVMRTIVNKIVAVLNVDKCSILLFDKQSQSLMVRFSHGLPKEALKQTQIKPHEEISGRVFACKEPVLVKDIEKDERFAHVNRESYYTKSFISVPLMVQENAIGVINVNDKKTKEAFSEEEFDFVQKLASEASVAIENARLYSSLQETSLDAFMALTSAIDDKDHYTKKHSLDVTKLSVAIAKEMDLSDMELINIRRAAMLHDIGKIGVHDDILIKEQDLTEEEWEEIKSHPIRGANILKPLHFLEQVILYIEQHHERYDGGGYPQGLQGDAISVGARIIAVADSFCAMTTERPYKKALTKENALAEIERNRGKQFFPEVVDVFLRLMREDASLGKEKEAT